MRYLFALTTLCIGALGGLLVYRDLTSGPPVVLPPPTQLQVSAAGTPLLPGGWTNVPTLTLSAHAPLSAVPSGIDVEVQPPGQAFNNSPTQSAGSSSQSNVHCGSRTNCAFTPSDPAVRVHLADGSYHLQVRLHNGRGVSPWVAYPHILRVDTQPPTLPRISSATDPDPTRIYHSSTLGFEWTSSDAGSGITGYSYRLDTDPHSVAAPELRTLQSAVRLVGLNTGTYYFHVRALDRAGNWSASASFPVHIDVTPPGLAHVRFSAFQFDPQFDALRVSFAVTRPATTVHVGVYRQNDQQLVRLYRLGNVAAGQRTVLAWDGKDASGRPLAAGKYEIYIRLTDRYGHSSLTGWNDFVVDYRRIVVSLSQQKLYAYDGNQLLLTSLVTTGNRALPTPPGTYHIMVKFHPFTFKSPWPKSSLFYYPPSKVQYALLFQAKGYYIHDAPWRSVFGPGSNSQLGTPGNNYTGTHGCVNTPPDVAQRLFTWAQIGTVVQVIQ